MTKEESLRLEKILTKIDKAGEADYRKQEEYNRFCMNTREDWNEEQYQILRREKTLTEAAYLASLVELKAEVKSMLTQYVKDEMKQTDDTKVCIALAIPGETEKTEITHTKKAISVSAPKISLEFDKLSHQF